MTARQTLRFASLYIQAMSGYAQRVAAVARGFEAADKAARMSKGRSVNALSGGLFWAAGVSQETADIINDVDDAFSKIQC